MEGVNAVQLAPNATSFLQHQAGLMTKTFDQTSELPNLIIQA
jgi:hypothetical protein